MDTLLDRDTILRRLADHREDLRALGVRRLGLFGSYLHGHQRPDSDLDFVVSFTEPTFDNYMEVKFLLERLFDRGVDLVTEPALKPALRYVKDEAAHATGTGEERSPP